MTEDVKNLGPDSAAAWDRFVDDWPGAGFFHRAGWKTVIQSSYGHDCHFTYVERDGQITGVLPLVHVKSRLFGNALISNAFCIDGGPVGDAPACRVLTTKAEQLADRLGVDYLEYRGSVPVDPGWRTRNDLYAGFRKELDTDPEALLAAIPRKRRAVVRKGIDAGLAAEVDAGVERFYPVYAASVRDLGTPVFPRRYFANLVETFGNDCEILSVTQNGRVVASVLSFFFRDQVLPYYAGGVGPARDVGAYDFMYWQVMRRAVARGCRVFDFGRSKFGTGAFDYKRHWGFEPSPLSYAYRLKPGSQMPDVNPLNPKYRLAIAVWKRLPLPIANRLGPLLAAGLG